MAGKTARETLAGRIDELPKPILDRIRTGYGAISHASAADIRNVTIALSQKIANRDMPKPDDVQAISGVTPNNYESVLIAISITFSMIVDLEVSSDDFIVSARGKLFSEHDERPAMAVVGAILKDRLALSNKIEDGLVANSLLPSMSRFDVEIDVRFRFEEGQLIRSVPIALVHVDTDVDRQEIFFQLRSSEVQSVIEKLSSALKEMEIASALVSERMQ